MGQHSEWQKDKHLGSEMEWTTVQSMGWRTAMHLVSHWEPHSVELMELSWELTTATVKDILTDWHLATHSE